MLPTPPAFPDGSGETSGTDLLRGNVGDILSFFAAPFQPNNPGSPSRGSGRPRPRGRPPIPGRMVNSSPSAGATFFTHAGLPNGTPRRTLSRNRANSASVWAVLTRTNHVEGLQHQSHEAVIVVFTVKDRGALVAPVHHVITIAADGGAGSTWHARIVPHPRAGRKDPSRNVSEGQRVSKSRG